VARSCEVTDFKFGTRAPMDNPDMNPVKNFRKGAWLGSHDPVHLWALNANSSKMAKDTNF